ncbi:MAG: hypothetical protein Q9178_003009 [Gyalolechia marmorata]
MTESNRDLFTGLPDELLVTIVQYSAKSDLPAIRLLCHRCHDIATSYLFERVITRTDKTKEQISQCPTRLLRQHAKELRISVIGWSDMEKNSAYNEGQNGTELSSFHDCFHQEQARKRYKRLEDELYDYLHGRRCPGYLYPVLSMKSLRKVLLTNGSFDPHSSPHGECGVLNCTQRNPVYAKFATDDCATVHFRLMMIALSQRDVPITELIVKGNNDSHFVLTYKSFNIPQLPTGGLMLQVFSNLTKLHLDLDTTTKDYRQFIGLTSTSLNRTLRCATKLEHLSINLVIAEATMWWPHRSIVGVLNNCVFAGLKTCLLSGFTCSATMILGFFVGCAKVEELCIDWCRLSPDGTWEEVADWLKEMLLSLKDVQLTKLIGDLGTDNRDDMLDDVYETSSYDNRYGLVQDFFFRGGVNPFGAAGRALERAKYAANAERLVIPGWFERMKKHHGYEEDLS